MAQPTHSSNLKWKFPLETRNGELFEVETFWSSCKGSFWNFFVTIRRGQQSVTAEVNTSFSMISNTDFNLKLNTLDAKLRSKGESLSLTEIESTSFWKDLHDLAMTSFPQITPREAYSQYFL
jgi:hypothetical protein